MANDSIRPELMQAYSTLLEELDNVTSKACDEVMKSRSELIGAAEPGAPKPGAAQSYDVEVTYDGGDFLFDLHWVLTPHGSNRPVLRFSATGLLPPVADKFTRKGRAILHYAPEQIIGWRFTGEGTFERTMASGNWLGLTFENIGNWVSAPFPFSGVKLLYAGRISRP